MSIVYVIAVALCIALVAVNVIRDFGTNHR